MHVPAKGITQRVVTLIEVKLDTAQVPWPATAYFYRTSAGAEIDLVIERPDRSIWAIEIKRGLSAKLERGFFIACEDLKPVRRFVVHAREDRYPVTKEVEAIGLRELTELLRAQETA